MYASEMQQLNKVPLIGFGVAGNQGLFIMRSRNGAIAQATQSKQASKGSKRCKQAPAMPEQTLGEITESRCSGRRARDVPRVIADR